MNLVTQLNWEVGRSTSAETPPEKFIPARVPGAVQLDWARAHGWPSHHWNCEPERYSGLEDFFWHYRTTLPPKPAGDLEPWLVLQDVDHRAIVRLNGRELARDGGIGRTLKVPLPTGEISSKALLEVIILAAPKEPDQCGRSEAMRTTKAAVSYGWDFHPRLIPLGLAGKTFVQWRPLNHIAAVEWHARLSDDLTQAQFAVNVRLRGSGALQAELRDPRGNVVWCESRDAVSSDIKLSGVLQSPSLWWPQGHGLQALYRLSVRFAGQDTFERKVGFRKTRLVMSPGQWEAPGAFPKSRSLPPFTLEVNGRKIFAKGANVVGPDIFHGEVTQERWHRLVELATQAHMNTLRLWGGSAIADEAFYEACDELGVMVVQEFPLACNCYPDDPAYLAELESLAREVIGRMVFHPCVVLWSGGNELFNVWSGMTDQSHALRLLNSLCWQLDPDTPFVPTLPIEGVGHGYYLFRDPHSGVECFQIFQRSRNTGYTEFGVPCPSSVEAIRALMPAEDLWPPRDGGAWKMHSGFGAWDIEPTSWMCVSTIEHYWGTQKNLQELVMKGQWLAAEGLKGLIEEARRQWPRCGWALVWCFNEPWPTVANLSLLSYPDQPKPSYEAVAQAMRPTLASARVKKFQWSSGEIFEAGLWILHDGVERRPDLTLHAVLSCGGWREELLVWRCPAGTGDRVGPVLRCVLPELSGEELVLNLVTDPAEYGNSYRFAVGHLSEKELRKGQPRTLNA